MPPFGNKSPNIEKIIKEMSPEEADAIDATFDNLKRLLPNTKLTGLFFSRLHRDLVMSGLMSKETLEAYLTFKNITWTKSPSLEDLRKSQLATAVQQLAKTQKLSDADEKERRDAIEKSRRDAAFTVANDGPEANDDGKVLVRHPVTGELVTKRSLEEEGGK